MKYLSRILILAMLFFSQAAFAITPDDLHAVQYDTIFYDPNATGGSVAGSGGCVSPLLPTITDTVALAASIDAYIKKTVPSSPLIGAGANFVQGGIDNGINPLWVVSIAQHESSFGTAGIATEGTNNSFGLTASSNQPSVNISGRNWYKFDSFILSPLHESEYLKQNYIDEGLTTLPAIVHKYAPNGDGGNNEDSYVASVVSAIQNLVIAAGSSLSCPADTVSYNPHLSNLYAFHIPDTAYIKQRYL